MDYLSCDECGVEDETVKETVDPFMEEIYCEAIKCNLCANCYNLSCDEI